MKKTFMTIDEIIEKEKKGIALGGCPFDISLIPNNMGINLCSVEGISWTELKDGQLIDLKIIFIPNREK